MKITLITRSGGKIVGAFQGHPSDPAPKSGIRATLYPGPGRSFTRSTSLMRFSRSMQSLRKS
jgi:hypothetical protein